MFVIFIAAVLVFEIVYFDKVSAETLLWITIFELLHKILTGQLVNPSVCANK